MSKSTQKELIKRWQTEKGKVEQFEIIKCLKKRKNLRSLPFLSHYEGRLDLRGIDLSVPPLEQDKKIRFRLNQALDFSIGEVHWFKHLKLYDADLSYSNLSNITFEKCSFENIQCVNANCREWNDRSSKFSDVNFQNTDFRRAALGNREARYHNVSFQNANLNSVFCYSGYFVDCDFSQAKVKNVNFQASHFIRCRFSGPLQSLWFRGYYPSQALEKEFGRTEKNPMEEVDFSGAVFDDVGFNNGCELTNVTLPQNQEHFFFSYWPSVLKITRQQIDKVLDKEFRQDAHAWINARMWQLDNQHEYIVNRREFENDLYSQNITGTENKRQFSVQFIDLLKTIEKELSTRSF